MGRITTRKRIHKVSGGTSRIREDVLAVEEPLEIRIAGTPLSVTMRTPGHDVELAAGFLLAEGVIRGKDDFLTAMHCGGPGSGGDANTYNVLDIALAPGVPAPATNPTRSFTTTSACGVCGKASIDDVFTRSQWQLGEDLATLSPELLATFPDALRTKQSIFDSTGGVHAAGLFTTSGELLVVREDVGRHNAVDKVIGWALLNDRLPLRDTVLQVSGRASFELVQKATMAGIPILGAVSAPSSLAVELADGAALTLIGFMRGENFNVYTHAHRLGL